MYTADGVVSTDHWVATKVGEDMLRAGGNAIDAAAAVEFALNVVNPNLAGIGGGSAVVVRLANGEAVGDRRPRACAARDNGGPVQREDRGGCRYQRLLRRRPGDAAHGRRDAEAVGDDVARRRAPGADRARRERRAGRQFLASGSAEARTLDLQPETIAMFRRPTGRRCKPATRSSSTTSRRRSG